MIIRCKIRNIVFSILFTLLQQQHDVIAFSWILSIAPYDEECYLLRTPKTMIGTKAIIGNIELIEDGGISNNDENNNGKEITADPLLAYVMEATKTEKILWRSTPGQSRAFFKVAIDPGKAYWICVQNSSHGPDSTEAEAEHPDFITRTVGFTYTVKDWHERTLPMVFKEENQVEWEVKSAAVEEEMKTLVNHHDYMRVREAKHRMVVEHTFSALLTWTLTEVTMVIIIAVGQVMYFRRFLEQRRYM